VIRTLGLWCARATISKQGFGKRNAPAPLRSYRGLEAS
jgi:hypothetical protein